MFQLKAENIFLFLAACTVGLLIFSSTLVERTIDIAPGVGTYRVILTSDVMDEGDSEVYWVDKENYEWECKLTTTFDYPFCSFQLFFSSDFTQGIDLSSLNNISLSLDYNGSAESIRLFLRNSNPDYTVNGVELSAKFNMVEINTAHLDKPYTVFKSDFRVADWWLLDHNIPVEKSHVELDNVGFIEIQTGTEVQAGKHSFKLKNIKLTTKWLSTENFYLYIILFWLFTIVVYFVYRLQNLNREVQTRKIKEATLTERNAVLDRRTKSLEEKTKKDVLTGALNRSGIEPYIHNSFNDWVKSSQPFSLLFFDVDHFKIINDTHGHNAGDLVLKELVQLVQENLSSGHQFARWGGEEFIIINAASNLEKATKLAEMLRRLIDQNKFSSGLKVTVSFGVAEINNGEGLEALFSRVDAALYEAKNKGRNQVRASEV